MYFTFYISGECTGKNNVLPVLPIKVLVIHLLGKYFKISTKYIFNRINI